MPFALSALHSLPSLFSYASSTPLPLSFPSNRPSGTPSSLPSLSALALTPPRPSLSSSRASTCSAARRSHSSHFPFAHPALAHPSLSSSRSSHSTPSSFPRRLPTSTLSFLCSPHNSSSRYPVPSSPSHSRLDLSFPPRPPTSLPSPFPPPSHSFPLALSTPSLSLSLSAPPTPPSLFLSSPSHSRPSLFLSRLAPRSFPLRPPTPPSRFPFRASPPSLFITFSRPPTPSLLLRLCFAPPAHPTPSALPFSGLSRLTLLPPSPFRTLALHCSCPLFSPHRPPTPARLAFPRSGASSSLRHLALLLPPSLSLIALPSRPSFLCASRASALLPALLRLLASLATPSLVFSALALGHFLRSRPLHSLLSFSPSRPSHSPPVSLPSSPPTPSLSFPSLFPLALPPCPPFSFPSRLPTPFPLALSHSLLSSPTLPLLSSRPPTPSLSFRRPSEYLRKAVYQPL
ncbi:hypothetical protein C7M84_020023 [Penaeus vannamei]|uniref:Uncharacterized protein n=1 Tax=Penaeus vannamei TaxID=6689 RepID=A0A423SD86_PENVA|nr:hypothetical protein C7M84_020023 [Penaeus vannamei]